jgi:hypothetical protein
LVVRHAEAATREKQRRLDVETAVVAEREKDARDFEKRGAELEKDLRDALAEAKRVAELCAVETELLGVERARRAEEAALKAERTRRDEEARRDSRGATRWRLSRRRRLWRRRRASPRRRLRAPIARAATLRRVGKETPSSEPLRRRRRLGRRRRRRSVRRRLKPRLRNATPDEKKRRSNAGGRFAR